ncbi:mediator of RNA polymerase II transcription subunit 7 [Massariosphaeria phaeospora]|uniref:Mediator of RNA polymerase II transcription subunit 7 n=1 Tax=Massariosphaeria phaeospora TaxID=100035 RepID=A0A7C8M6Z5_9PLEO|nr:mediator of RNA polymerase II transcription subunit 7 [Massariosphaeria phaeospora]
MADASQDEEQLVAYFPDAPPFYKHFTPGNQDRLKQLQKEAASDSHNDGTASPQLSAAQRLDLPPELRYLVPPEPPAMDEEYHVFGEPARLRGIDQFDHILEFIKADMERTYTLAGWEYQQLYPAAPTPGSAPDASLGLDWADRQRYLFRFLRSILLNFVELLGILANQPDSDDKDDKLKDILTLVLNMHALINEYRPHQARETLIRMMGEQLARKKAEVDGIKRIKQKVEDTLAEFGKTAPDAEMTTTPEQEAALATEEKRRATQRHMWHAMDEMLGH